MVYSDSKPTILLIGLDQNLAEELGAKIAENESRVYKTPGSDDCEKVLDRVCPDLVFCPSDRRHFLNVLAAARRSPRRVPVVAVSRAPEVTEWLDAMEAGASDYCGAPFESRDIRWILTTNLERRSLTAGSLA